MATTKKPSAAQLAARKRFAEMARSGQLARKKAAPKKAAPKRKANPMRKTTPNAPRAINPIRKPTRRAGETLPHRVHLCGATASHPGQLVGAFNTREVALQFATGYANLHGKACLVVSE